MKLSLRLMLTLLVVFAPRLARAQLDVDACVAVEASAIERIIDVEIPDLDTHSVQVNVSCVGERVRVRVVVPERTLQRTFALMQAGHARHIALEVVEMLTLALRSQVDGPQHNEESDEEIDEELDDEEDEDLEFTRNTRLGLFGRVELGRRPLMLSAGAGVFADIDALEWLAFGIEAVFVRSSESVAEGDVDVSLVGGSILALVHHTWGRTRVRVGPGVRIAWIDMRGDAQTAGVRGTRHNALTWGPLLVGGVGISITQSILLGVGVELGVVARQVSAGIGDQVLVRETGFRGALDVRVGFVL